MLSAVQTLSYKIRSELLKWSNFENVIRIARLLYESDVLLAEEEKNGNVVMTICHVLTQEAITAVLFPKDVVDETTAKALFQIMFIAH